MPKYANYLPLATSGLGISILAERTNIYNIAQNLNFGYITRYKNGEKIKNFVQSCKQFMKNLDEGKGME